MKVQVPYWTEGVSPSVLFAFITTEQVPRRHRVGSVCFVKIRRGGDFR